MICWELLKGWRSHPNARPDSCLSTAMYKTFHTQPSTHTGTALRRCARLTHSFGPFWKQQARICSSALWRRIRVLNGSSIWPEHGTSNRAADVRSQPAAHNLHNRTPSAFSHFLLFFFPFSLLILHFLHRDCQQAIFSNIYSIHNINNVSLKPN